MGDLLHNSLLRILDCILALLALINPVSKIFIMSLIAEKSSFREVERISIRASLVAAIILLTFLFVGNPLLVHVFHVHIYSFKIAGGMVLVYRGFEALNKGLFFEYKYTRKLTDFSIVPLASPMIAGPATITASVSFPAKYGTAITMISIIVAIGINLLIMLSSRYIHAHLKRHNIMGALIRITGLIVATIGIQMVLDGVSEYLISQRSAS
ncbi:MAG: MarC family protein [Spirochaetes bacterium]|nr:MarC family protein [Spirochaetota bacterium]